MRRTIFEAEHDAFRESVRAFCEKEIAPHHAEWEKAGFAVHTDINSAYLLDLCTDEQKARWLPGFASGELITAIAMTEPGAGSDLARLKTTAKRDGDHYILNGAKTFISN